MNARLALLHRIVVALAVLLPVGANTAAADPPERAGRLSHLEGTVSFRAVDQTEWSAATLNYPVTVGHGFWTERESRAEIQIGPAELRLDQSTEVEVLRLDESSTLFRLRQGTANVRVRALSPGGFQVETPQGTVDLEPGRYRIDVWPPDDTPIEAVQVTVFEGAARLSGPGATVDIAPGERVVIEGEPPESKKITAEPTPFDEWALARERTLTAAETARHVSPQVTGYQDLERHGRWRSVPDYGPVWVPNDVPPGWAPYRHGHWAYVPPWGWTWVDDAPWGFAPFHYGRWVFIDDHWAWWPGTYVARPVYAPALVVFIGHGHHHHIGWVPLGPREIFHPYYPSSVTHVHRVNHAVVHRTVIHNVTSGHQHREAKHFTNHRAATIVPASTVTSAAPVHRAAMRASHDQVALARPTSNVAHLTPSAAARAGGSKAVESRAPGPRPAAHNRDDRGHQPQAADAPRARANPAPSREAREGPATQNRRPEDHNKVESKPSERPKAERHQADRNDADRNPSVAATPRAAAPATRDAGGRRNELRPDESHPRNSQPEGRRDMDSAPRAPNANPRHEQSKPNTAPALPPSNGRHEDRSPSVAARPHSAPQAVTPREAPGNGHAPAPKPQFHEPRRDNAPPMAAPPVHVRPPVQHAPPQAHRPPPPASAPRAAAPSAPPPARHAAPPPRSVPAPPQKQHDRKP